MVIRFVIRHMGSIPVRLKGHCSWLLARLRRCISNPRIQIRDLRPRISQIQDFKSEIEDQDLRLKIYLFFAGTLGFNNAKTSFLTASQAKELGSTTSKWPAFSITTSFESSPFFFAASA